MPPDTPAATRFVVKRLNWYAGDRGRSFRFPGETAVASFATADEAEVDRRRREEEVRRVVNPFACGSALHYLTHLDEPRLRDWLMDYGIDPPEPKKNGNTDWADWWKKSHKKLSAEKVAAVWEALDKVRFFAVAAEPVRPVGYAVIEVNWNYNDEYHDADPEGGKLVKVYRTRERAAEECERRNAEAREQWGVPGEEDYDPADFDPDHDLPMFDTRERLLARRGLTDSKRLRHGEGLYPTTAGVPFFEVVEVPLEGLG